MSWKFGIIFLKRFVLVLNDGEAIKAYVDKRESENYYLDAFDAFSDNDGAFKWKWSWWAFGGGVFFLLYRKLYLEALVFFLITLVANSVPVAGAVIWFASGGIFPYFVYKRYLKTKQEIEENISGNANQIEALRTRGGVNDWALWIGVAINVIALAYLVFAASALMPGMSVSMPD